MPFVYNKFFALLDERGLKKHSIRQSNIISQSALHKMVSGKGSIDTRTLERICSTFNCQPGDIMEYIPDEEKALPDKGDK